MAKLIFLPVADRINSGTYLLDDGACGTDGMLTMAEETLRQLAAEHGKEVATHLYGQEINAETYAIYKADLLLKDEGAAADNIVGGPEHSILSNETRGGGAGTNQPLRPGLGRHRQMGEPRDTRRRRCFSGPIVDGQLDRTPDAMAEQAPVAAMAPVEILEGADALAGTKGSSRSSGWPRVVAVLGRHAI